MDKVNLFLKENKKIVDEASKYFQILNDKVEKANEELKKISIISKCGIEVYSEHLKENVTLFVKKNGIHWYYYIMTRRLVKELANSSWEMQLEMLDHIDDLLKAIVENNRTKLDKLKEKLK